LLLVEADALIDEVDACSFDRDAGLRVEYAHVEPGLGVSRRHAKEEQEKTCQHASQDTATQSGNVMNGWMHDKQAEWQGVG
jgi:hypothetical protein